jgi:hypothetical protein
VACTYQVYTGLFQAVIVLRLGAYISLKFLSPATERSLYSTTLPPRSEHSRMDSSNSSDVLLIEEVIEAQQLYTVSDTLPMPFSYVSLRLFYIVMFIRSISLVSNPFLSALATPVLHASSVKSHPNHLSSLIHLSLPSPSWMCIALNIRLHHHRLRRNRTNMVLQSHALEMAIFDPEVFAFC